MNSNSQTKLQKTPLKAFALAYEDPDRLPQVLASGNDELARLILEIARNAAVPIKENKELVSLLEHQKSGPIISSKALKVLAEVIAFLYHTDNLWKERHLKLATVLE